MPQTIHPLLFLDLETTGHDPLMRLGRMIVPWHEIIDAGGLLIDQRDLSIIDMFECKMKPGHPERCLPKLVNDYPERARRGEWDNAILLEAAIGRLLDFAGQTGVPAILAGQNFFFDWNFLMVSLALCDVTETMRDAAFHYTRLDVRSMAVDALLKPGEVYDPGEFSMRNGKLLARLGIEPEPEVHTGPNGAMKSLEVYRKLSQLRAARA